jgi:methylated-DNA-[protein]-cysteine S-methyltransferase
MMSKETERKYDTVVNTPFKKLGLKIKNDAIAHVELLDVDDEHKQSLDIVALEATAQIKQYCQNADFTFDLPLHLEGTAFQKKVWKAIASIPKGEVRTYGEIAEQVNSSARAVGNACAVNPVPVIIPCHRVVAKDGFGGYAGETLEKSPRGLIRVKGWLLLHEGVLQAQVDGKAVSGSQENSD